MKKLVIRFSIIILYLFVVLSIFKFDIASMIDLKSIVLVIGGTIFLSLGSMKKGLKKQDIFSIISWNAIVVSYLICFIYLFTNLSERNTGESLFLEIALNSRALLYGFIIFVVFRDDQRVNKANVIHNETKTLTAEEIYHLFIESGLTKREAEIARLARNGLSNKEIGEEMYIAESTVKKHMSHIFEKLAINSREELKEIVSARRI